MIRSRPLALLATLLLLPGEAARAGAWCGVAGGQAMTHAMPVVERHADAQVDAMTDAPMPASHAAHHAMTTDDGDAPTPPRSQADCPLMAACASAAVSIIVRLSEGATRDVTARANADEPDALATRSIAPEPPPPR